VGGQLTLLLISIAPLFVAVFGFKQEPVFTVFTLSFLCFRNFGSVFPYFPSR
jgi:hypothetical protein